MSRAVAKLSPTLSRPPEAVLEAMREAGRSLARQVIAAERAAAAPPEDDPPQPPGRQPVTPEIDLPPEVRRLVVPFAIELAGVIDGTFWDRRDGAEREWLIKTAEVLLGCAVARANIMDQDAKP